MTAKILVKLFVVISLLLTATLWLISPPGRVVAQEPMGGDIGAQAAIGTTFTYQGRLTDGGSPANGSYDLEFKLYDGAAGGAQIGSTITKDNVAISGGLFTVELDFGGSAFDGTARWLQIGVRPGNDAGAYTALSPRQPLRPAPYAINAGVNGLRVLNPSGDGLYVTSPGSDGVEVQGAKGSGLFVLNPVYSGLDVRNPGDDGLNVTAPGNNGAQINSAKGNGVYAYAPAFAGLRVDNSGSDAIQIFSPGFNGLYVQNPKTNGVSVNSPVFAGLRIDNSGSDAIQIFSSGFAGLRIDNAGGNGVHVNSAKNYAGYFNGQVLVTGNLTKGGGSFKIDHPLDPQNKYLYHSFVESPDMMNIYNGNVTLDAQGAAWVDMPRWFEALNQDFRYQLTPIGGPGPNLHIVQEITNNRFRIAGGQPGLKVSWQVTGIRHDPYAEAHRIPVEEEKPAAEQGTYLHPLEYQQPETMGLNYRQNSDLSAQAGVVAGQTATGGPISNQEGFK